MAEQQPPTRRSTTRLRASRSSRGRAEGARLFGERQWRQPEVEVLSSDDDDDDNNNSRPRPNAFPAAAGWPIRQPKRNETDDDDSSVSSSSQAHSRRHHRRRRRRTRRSSSATGTKTTGLSDSETASPARKSARHTRAPPKKNVKVETAGFSQEEPIELDDDEDDNNNHNNAALLAVAATEDDPIVIESSDGCSDSELEAMVGEAIQRSLEDQRLLWQAASRKNNNNKDSHRLRSSGRPTNNSQRRKTFSPMPVARKKAPPKRSKSTQEDFKPAVKFSVNEILAATVPGKEESGTSIEANSTRETKESLTKMDTTEKTKSDTSDIATNLPRKPSPEISSEPGRPDNEDIRSEQDPVGPRSKANDQEATKVNNLAADKTGAIKQEENVVFPKSRKRNRKWPRNAKDLGCHIQVSRAITCYPARMVLDEHNREMISDAGLALVQWSDSQQREEVLREDIIRCDDTGTGNNDNQASTTRRSRRKQVKPSTLQDYVEKSDSDSDTAKSRSTRCKSEPEMDESHEESDTSIDIEAIYEQAKKKAPKRQVRSKVTKSQSKRKKLCSDDSVISNKPLDVKPSADGDAAVLEPAPSVQQQREGRKPAPSHPRSRHAHLPIGPHPKLAVSRYRKDPPKPKYARPRRPEIGGTVYLLRTDLHRQPCIRPYDLYMGQKAKVVGDSVFAFMSRHERLLQLEVCDEDGQKRRWYVKESEVSRPRLLDR